MEKNQIGNYFKHVVNKHKDMNKDYDLKYMIGEDSDTSELSISNKWDNTINNSKNKMDSRQQRLLMLSNL